MSAHKAVRKGSKQYNGTRGKKLSYTKDGKTHLKGRGLTVIGVLSGSGAGTKQSTPLQQQASLL